MTKRLVPESKSPFILGASGVERKNRGLCQMAFVAAAAVLLAGSAAWGQVITIDTSGKGAVATTGPVDRMYQQIQPTHVELSNRPLDAKTRLMLLRTLQSEQGFAMRPIPRGHKGLKLEANGELQPAGEAYLNMATSDGISAKPGDRVVITNIRVDHSKLILDLNGGPDAKHRFLRHIQIGMGDPSYGDPTQPIVPDSGQQPSGARLTLEFHGNVPELTGDQVEALLAPLISFKVQTPVEAYTATLPPALKKAILDHQVLVGMNTEMLMFAKGRPDNKYRENEGDTPYTVWMYGKPPQTVDFVKLNGNRVVRVEIARVGQPLEVFDKDVVTPLMQGNTAPLEANNRHVVQEGDVHRNPDTQAPAPPPSLRQPGDTLPTDNDKNGAGVMKPVYFPPEKPDPDDTTSLGRNPDSQPTQKPSSPPSSKPQAQPAGNSPGSAQPDGNPRHQSQPSGDSQQQAPSGNSQPQ